MREAHPRRQRQRLQRAHRRARDVEDDDAKAARPDDEIERAKRALDRELQDVRLARSPTGEGGWFVEGVVD